VVRGGGSPTREKGRAAELPHRPTSKNGSYAVRRKFRAFLLGNVHRSRTRNTRGRRRQRGRLSRRRWRPTGNYMTRGGGGDEIGAYRAAWAAEAQQAQAQALPAPARAPEERASARTAARAAASTGATGASASRLLRHGLLSARSTTAWSTSARTAARATASTGARRARTRTKQCPPRPRARAPGTPSF
jgi:hypothetical protein